MKTRHFLYIAALMAAACQSGNTDQAEHDHEHAPVAYPMGLPQQDTVYSAVECVGVVDVPPQSRATVSAPLGGFLRDVRFYPGDRVEKGQWLARVAHPDYVALQREYLDAKARVAYLETDLARKKELLASSAMNERTVQELESELAVQRNTKSAAAAGLRQIGLDPSSLSADNIQSELSLRSPINGYITHIDANLGQHVTPEQPLYEIVDDDHMHIELSVFPRDIAGIHAGQDIEFSIPGDAHRYSGKVQLVGRQVMPESGAFVVHAHPEENIVGLRPGQFVEGTIIRDPRAAWILPKGAVVSDGDHYVVFEKDGDEYIKRTVEVGEELERGWEILEELPAPVVLENAHLLMETGEGHSH